MVDNFLLINLTTALGDFPAVSMPIARSLKTKKTSVALCCVKTLHILEWPFIVTRTK